MKVLSRLSSVVLSGFTRSSCWCFGFIIVLPVSEREDPPRSGERISLSFY